MEEEQGWLVETLWSTIGVFALTFFISLFLTFLWVMAGAIDSKAGTKLQSRVHGIRTAFRSKLDSDEEAAAAEVQTITPTPEVIPPEREHSQVQQRTPNRVVDASKGPFQEARHNETFIPRSEEPIENGSIF